jgi:hypothetical protein
MTIKGAMVAASVAGLFLAAAPQAAQAKDAAGGDVKCQGVNDCHGKGGCKSATNDCAGKNGCKGKGWIKTSEKDCTTKGGKVVSAK